MIMLIPGHDKGKMKTRQIFMIILYNSAFFLFSLLYFPLFILKRKWHKDFFMRFGLIYPERLNLDHRKKIWIHAVSVGEVLVAKSLMQAIRHRFFNYQIIISTATKTGYDLAKSAARPEDVVIFSPLDFSFSVRAYIQILKPEIFINTETEIWPNLFTALHQQGIPIVQVNGRISDQAFSGYRLIRFFIKPVLAYIYHFCMQTDQDALRIETLGACPDRISVTGNMKFDDIIQAGDLDLKGLDSNDSLDFLIAGSTHPGEEEIILDVFNHLRNQYKKLRLLIVPRHPHRADVICRIVKQKALDPVRFSILDQLDFSQEKVVVVDAIGYLRALYQLAKIVFVGKSLTVSGGHNIIEPAFFQKPILVGPLTYNFRDVVRVFLERQAIIQVKNEKDLLISIEELLADPSKCAELGYRARAVIEEQKGAIDKTVHLISEVLQ